MIRLKALLGFYNLSQNVMMTIATDGRILSVSPSVKSILNLSVNQMLGENAFGLIHPDDRTRALDELTKLMNGHVNTCCTLRVRTADDSYKWLSWRACLIAGQIYTIGEDETDKMELMKETEMLSAEKEQNATEALLKGQEIERIEIGKELHDNVNQMLTSAKLYQEIALTDEAGRTQWIKKSRAIITNAIEEIRMLSRTMVMPTVDDFDLQDAIIDLVEITKYHSKMKIHLDMEGEFCKLTSKAKVTLYRIVQEQLNNVKKHAKASRVDVCLIMTNGLLQLLIKDNGKGFDVTQKRKGIGLSNISSRVALYNGRLEIQTAPGEGCCLMVNFEIEPLLLAA